MEIRKLNSLRGLAALIVVVGHYSNESGLWGTDCGVVLGNGAGQFGVMIFFLLSAFLISYLYLDAPPTLQSLANFAIARVARVAPLYLIIVIVSFAVINYLPSQFIPFVYNIPDLNALLSHLLFLKGRNVLWSIPPEIHFYIFFAIVWVLRPILQKMLWVAVAILSAISYIFWEGAAPATSILGLEATIYIIQVFPYFAMGAFLGQLFKHWQPHARICSHYYVLALLVIPLLFPTTFCYLTNQQHGMWASVRILACVSIVFFVVVFLVPDKNRVLENWFGDMLGKISYSLYLLHYPLLLWLKNIGIAKGVGGLALFLLLASVLAWISFFVFELPMRQRIRALSLHKEVAS